MLDVESEGVEGVTLEAVADRRDRALVVLVGALRGGQVPSHDPHAERVGGGQEATVAAVSTMTSAERKFAVWRKSVQTPRSFIPATACSGLRHTA